MTPRAIVIVCAITIGVGVFTAHCGVWGAVGALVGVAVGYVAYRFL